VKIIDILAQKGARVSYHDPHIPRCSGMRRYPDLDMASVPLTPETLQQADLVLLVTDHSAFDYAWIAQEARLIVDTRNAFKGQKGAHIFPA
jgi:UDP-N-acetyl-D-glucosamine dehydrogenase